VRAPAARWQVPPGVRRWASSAGAAATLAVVVWRLGAAPFRDGLRAVDGWTLAAGVGIGMLTTLCCAWRWTLVARGLGVSLSLPAAVAAYYRSLFLNVTLPGGVVGDVHRGVSHGHAVRDVGGALRAVVLERAAGQVVQLVLTAVVLLALPSPVRASMPLAAAALVTAAVGVLALTRARADATGARWARAWRAVARDVRQGLHGARALPAIALASALVVAGHAATFLIAARAVGITAPPSRVLPLAVIAMLAMVLPSLAGWGPREGATAWAFGAAGLGADHGAATAVVYGLMALVASLPGALVLVGAGPWQAWSAWRRTEAPAAGGGPRVETKVTADA
jgi:glycosyltransferase 2 family protein